MFWTYPTCGCVENRNKVYIRKIVALYMRDYLLWLIHSPPPNLSPKTRELFIMKTNMKHEKNIINIYTVQRASGEEVWGRKSENTRRGSMCGAAFFCFSEMTGIIQFGHRINSNLYMFYIWVYESMKHFSVKVNTKWDRDGAWGGSSWFSP